MTRYCRNCQQELNGENWIEVQKTRPDGVKRSYVRGLCRPCYQAVMRNVHNEIYAREPPNSVPRSHKRKEDAPTEKPIEPGEPLSPRFATPQYIAWQAAIRAGVRATPITVGGVTYSLTAKGREELAEWEKNNAPE
jgi:hypothetical protein